MLIERWWNFGFCSIGGCPEQFEFYFKWFKYKALAYYEFHIYNQSNELDFECDERILYLIFPFPSIISKSCLYTYSMSNLIRTKIAQTENKEIEFDHF